MISAEIIRDCIEGKSLAQKKIYERLSPYLLGICRRYFSDISIAEDIMIESMFKIFDKLHQYSGQGNFMAWARKITVNACLMEIRKTKLQKSSLDDSHYEIQGQVFIEEDIHAQEILNLLDALPKGYRTVFNLYVIEGYKHREIAEILDISINTSKSQLILAKKKIQQLWLKKNQIQS